MKLLWQNWMMGNLWGKKCWNWPLITLDYFIIKYEVGGKKTQSVFPFVYPPSLRAKCIEIYLIGKKEAFKLRLMFFTWLQVARKMSCSSLRCSGSLAWLWKAWYLIKNVTLCAVIVTSCHGGVKERDRRRQSCHTATEGVRLQGTEGLTWSHSPPCSSTWPRIASRHLWNILSPLGLIWTAPTREIRDVCGWSTLFLLVISRWVTWQWHW